MLVSKEKNSRIYDRALTLVPEIEDSFGFDMCVEAMIKGNLPEYFNVHVHHNVYPEGLDTYDFVYMIESATDEGTIPCKVTVRDVGTPQEKVVLSEDTLEFLNMRNHKQEVLSK